MVTGALFKTEHFPHESYPIALVGKHIRGLTKNISYKNNNFLKRPSRTRNDQNSNFQMFFSLNDLSFIVRDLENPSRFYLIYTRQHTGALRANCLCIFECTHIFIRIYVSHLCIYTTWKVDGAIPMYWFIMAPY